jgi:ankyrin repeat protein
LLLKAGADPNLTTSASGFRSTPLNTTIMNAHGTPILKTLLEFIADFYGRDPEEMTAIYHVARSKTPDYALMLLEHNADIHAVGICHAERSAIQGL